MKKAYFLTLVFLLALLGIGALYGGITLIIDPEGVLLGLPLTLLDHSMFKDFLIPGILLFALFGLIPVLIIRPLFTKKKNRQ